MLLLQEYSSERAVRKMINVLANSGMASAVGGRLYAIHHGHHDIEQDQII